MDKLTPEELERFSELDTLTPDEFSDLLRRARSDPDAWMIVPATAGYVNDPTPLTTYGFWHKPTGKHFTFAYAVDNKIWFKTAAAERA